MVVPFLVTAAQLKKWKRIILDSPNAILNELVNNQLNEREMVNHIWKENPDHMTSHRPYLVVWVVTQKNIWCDEPYHALTENQKTTNKLTAPRVELFLRIGQAFPLCSLIKQQDFTARIARMRSVGLCARSVAHSATEWFVSETDHHFFQKLGLNSQSNPVQNNTIWPRAQPACEILRNQLRSVKNKAIQACLARKKRWIIHSAAWPSGQSSFVPFLAQFT